jgi:hypothetical protein
VKVLLIRDDNDLFNKRVRRRVRLMKWSEVGRMLTKRVNPASIINMAYN